MQCLFTKLLILVIYVVNVNSDCNICQENNHACHSENTYSLCINGKPEQNFVTCPENHVCTTDRLICKPLPDATPSCITQLVIPDQNLCSVCGESKVFACLNETTIIFCFGEDDPYPDTESPCPEDSVCDLNNAEFCSDAALVKPSCISVGPGGELPATTTTKEPTSTEPITTSAEPITTTTEPITTTTKPITTTPEPITTTTEPITTTSEPITTTVEPITTTTEQMTTTTNEPITTSTEPITTTTEAITTTTETIITTTEPITTTEQITTTTEPITTTAEAITTTTEPITTTTEAITTTTETITTTTEPITTTEQITTTTEPITTTAEAITTTTEPITTTTEAITTTTETITTTTEPITTTEQITETTEPITISTESITTISTEPITTTTEPITTTTEPITTTTEPITTTTEPITTTTEPITTTTEQITTTQEQTTTTEPTTTEPISTTPSTPRDANTICEAMGNVDGKYPSDDPTCTTYVNCISVNGVHYNKPVTCPSQQYFNPTSRLCTTVLPEGCIDDTTFISLTTTTEPTTEATTTTTEASTTTTLATPRDADTICKDAGSTGSYPADNDPTCKSFVVCYLASGLLKGLPKTCSAGQFFDTSTKVCTATKPTYCT